MVAQVYLSDTALNEPAVIGGAPKLYSDGNILSITSGSSVAVLERINGDWQQQASLVPDNFGERGVGLARTGASLSSGAVYLYKTG